MWKPCGLVVRRQKGLRGEPGTRTGVLARGGPELCHVFWRAAASEGEAVVWLRSSWLSDTTEVNVSHRTHNRERLREGRGVSALTCNNETRRVVAQKCQLSMGLKRCQIRIVATAINNSKHRCSVFRLAKSSTGRIHN